MKEKRQEAANMLEAEVVRLLNEQINKELFSAYVYLEIANYYADESLNGFENWFYIQTQEERDHAMLIRTCLLYTSRCVSETGFWLVPRRFPPAHWCR